MTLRLVVALLLAASTAGSPIAAAASFQDAPGVNPRAAVLADFSDRIDTYMELRNSVKDQGPELKEAEKAVAIDAAEVALAANIRKARADAKPGDVFTPAIRTEFRRLMYPELKGEEGRDAKAILRDDAPPPGAVPLKVNATYVADSKPTVPVNLLLNLPKLPQELEYRIVGRNLVLLDVDANLIVDFVPNAIR